MEKPLRIAIIGYGKMGKEIEKIIEERGHKLCAIIHRDYDLNELVESKAQVAIEFTEPNSAVRNIKFCIENNIPIVVGTTGWYNSLDEIKNDVKTHNSSLFTATNYSVGVNLFFHINKVLAKLMNQYPEYGIEIEEVHHTQKKDAPSGTAITTAENILSEFNSKNSWKCIEENKDNSPISENEIPIYAYRKDNVPGIHKVKWESDIDNIEISHTAHNRRGFALGSVLASEWLIDKKGIFGMNDLLGLS